MAVTKFSDISIIKDDKETPIHFHTADLYDEHMDKLQISLPGWQSFGNKNCFYGAIETVRTFEDNSLVKKVLKDPGKQRVLVIDGYASQKCALIGDRLAELAIENNWAGIVVNGFIRDSAQINEMPIGIKALGTIPRKSKKQNRGERGVELYFKEVLWKADHWLYSDQDGIAVAAEPLELSQS